MRNFANLLLLLALLLPTSFDVAAQQAESSVAALTGTPAANIDDEFIDEFDNSSTNGEPFQVWDPIEGFNRGMFWFNDKLYFYALKPVAKGFRYLPESARASISNFFNNLGAPVRLLNAVLQGKINDAGIELSRFIINTTVGIGGLFDPAKNYASLRQTDEDFGQTLGYWGVSPGFYLVLPVLGPSNARDGVALVGDYYVDPMEQIWQNREYWIARTVDTVNTVSLDKDTYESIKRDALDPYLFIRDAYMQNRAARVKK